MNIQNHTQITQPQNTNIPLHNLSEIRNHMDSLQCFISQSIKTNTLLPKQHLDTLSNQITSTIRRVIINATALLATCPVTETVTPTLINQHSENEIVELDAMELLAKHFHFCEICGKGFTRDANLRMHKRAHGEQFKTPEALRGVKETRFSATRFSCPFDGCKRNKMHKKFSPLKSVFCLRNHFKRSHCPKTHTCDLCRRKSFAMVSDLKSHVKQCKGESTWKCSCGTTFSRKEKLFGHVARFEGHSPAVEVGGEEKGMSMAVAEGDCLDGLPEGFFDGVESFWD